jgi:hypothetical protein
MLPTHRWWFWVCISATIIALIALAVVEEYIQKCA